MDEKRTIVKDDERFRQYLDFETLRNEGIAHIASFSGKVWTDHNLHDPGITILETLCYVLTDLDYRTRLNFKDLVARNDDTPENNFFTPAQILGNNPLTINDFRKLLIDIKGVRNAWVEKADADNTSLFWNATLKKLECCSATDNIQIPLNGLYKVYIEPDDIYASAYENDACGNSSFPMEQVLNEIEQRLHQHRNLCEDFSEIYILKEQLIGLCLHLDLEADADPENVLVDVFSNIQSFFSPTPTFYSLQEMLEKNRSIEEIFEGRPYNFSTNKPVQQQGFIDVENLNSIVRHLRVHASDLYRIIMDVKGVNGITKLTMFSDADDGQAESNDWILDLKQHHRPVLSAENSSVVFYKNRLPFTVNIANVQSRFVKNITEYNKFLKNDNELDLVVPNGNSLLKLDEYQSVQYELPEVYYVGRNTVPATETFTRKVQSLQLQAYLLFFDRLLADYLSQLSSIRKLFALSGNAGDAKQTWFPSVKPDIPGLTTLIRGGGPQSTGGYRGPLYTGMPLAFTPKNFDRNTFDFSRVNYNERYLRDEAIEEMINLFTNFLGNANIKTWQDTDALYHFYISNDEHEVLLNGYDRFDSEKNALQTARDVIFMASLGICYNPVNDLHQNIFSYDVIYNDAAYAEVTKILSESSSEYQQRKEGFLNHLLSRFSEDFTDYSLMMYALNGKKNDPAKSLIDKQNLLSSYPQISSGRGRAFDYSQLPAALPVTGLQERVAAMMGIEKPEGAPLSNFSLISVEDKFRFCYYLPALTDVNNNSPLFETLTFYDQHEKDEVLAAIVTLAANESSYKKYGCIGENVYGFYLKGVVGKELSSGTLIAKHSVEFDSADKRDLVIQWLVRFFQRGRAYTELVRANQGFYYILKDENQQELFVSATGYETSAQASDAVYYCLAILQNKDAYKIYERKETSDFQVHVVDLQHNDYPVLAKNNKFFGTWEEAQKALEKLWKYFVQKFLLYEEESAALFAWQLKYKETPTWRSSHFFQDENGLPGAFMQFLQLAASEYNYEINKGAEGRWLISVAVREKEVEEDGDVVIEIARHTQMYDSAELSRDTVKAYAALFARMIVRVNDAVVKVDATRYSLINPEDPIQSAVLLDVLLPVPAAVEGERYIAYIKSLLTNPGSLSVNTMEEGGGDCYAVQLKAEGGTLLAQSTAMLNYEAAEKLKSEIFLLATKHLLKEIKQEDISAYDIVWKDEKNNSLFKGGQLFESSTDATLALLGLLLQFQQIKIDKIHDAYYGYGFNIFKSNGTLIGKQFLWQDNALERDGVVENVLRTLQAALQETSFVTEHLYNYFFSVKDKVQKEMLLQGPEPLGSYNSARQAFYLTIERGRILSNYELTTDGCNYGFLLLDSGQKQTLALHPTVYSTAAARDQALKKMVAYLAQHGASYSIKELAGSWSYLWQWLSCARLPEIALEAAQEKYDEDEARIELEHLEELAREEINYDIREVNEGWQVKIYDMALDEKPFIAFHPQLFGCKMNAELFVKRMINWARRTSAGKDYPEKVPVLPTLEPANSEQGGYRLWDRQYRIAVNTKFFNKPSLRNEYLQLLAAQNQFKKFTYTIPDHGAFSVIEKDDGFHFRLFLNGQELWRSIENYETADAAGVAFEKQYINIFFTATDSSNFSTWPLDTSQLFLYNSEKKPIAVYESYFENKEAFDGAVSERVAAARRFPIYPSDRQYGFRLYSPDDFRYEWKSVKLYDDPKLALKDFILFLQLLKYPGNYCVKDEPLSCSFTIDIGKVLLDMNNDTSAEREPKDKDFTIVSRTMGNLESFLGKNAGDDGMFYPYMNYILDCSYSFRFVEGNNYRLARHTKWLNSMAQREQQRNRLMSQWECKSSLYTWGDPFPETTAPPSILECFPLVANADLEKLWLKPASKPRQTNWKPIQDIDKTWHNELMVGDDTIWIGLEKYPDKCAAQADDFFFIDILEFARAEQSYWYEPLSNKQNAYTLWLKDVDGKIVAKAAGIICGADRAKDMATRMLNAILYPVVRSDDGFTFEINDIDSNGLSSKNLCSPLFDLSTQNDTLKYCTVWEGINNYSTPDNAMKDYELTVKLLADINNYQRTEEDNCGRFGIEITDPTKVIGFHPMVHITKQENRDAISELKAAFSKEGFHVIEHILLRPLKQCEKLTLSQLRIPYHFAVGEGSATLYVVIKAETVFESSKEKHENLQFIEALQATVWNDRVYLEIVKDYFKLSFWSTDQVLIATSLININEISSLVNMGAEEATDPKKACPVLMPVLKGPFNASVDLSRYIENIDSGKNEHNCQGVLPVCTTDSFLVLENNLTVLTEDELRCDRRFEVDPYSFWATVVVPSWPVRFRTPKFRDFFENALRKEAPSHVRLHIVWVSPGDMDKFETAYRKWLAAFSRKESCDYSNNLENFSKVIAQLQNIFPTASTFEEDGTGEKRVVVLDETAID